MSSVLEKLQQLKDWANRNSDENAFFEVNYGLEVGNKWGVVVFPPGIDNSETFTRTSINLNQALSAALHTMDEKGLL